MNLITLTGRLTRKPELKNTTSGKSVCDFSIAVSRNYTNEDGKKEADFINIQVWDKQAENLCKYQDKGNSIAVVGSIRTRQYDDEKGNKRYVTYVLANNIEYLSSKKNEEVVKDNNLNKEENNDQVYIDFGNEIELTEENLGW